MITRALPGILAWFLLSALATLVTCAMTGTLHSPVFLAFAAGFYACLFCPLAAPPARDWPGTARGQRQ